MAQQENTGCGWKTWVIIIIAIAACFRYCSLPSCGDGKGDFFSSGPKACIGDESFPLTVKWTSLGNTYTVEFENGEYGTFYSDGGKTQIKSKTKFRCRYFSGSDVTVILLNDYGFPFIIGGTGPHFEEFYIVDGKVFPNKKAADSRDISYGWAELTYMK